VCQLLNAIAPCSVTTFKDKALEYVCYNLEAVLQNGYVVSDIIEGQFSDDIAVTSKNLTNTCLMNLMRPPVDCKLTAQSCLVQVNKRYRSARSTQILKSVLGRNGRPRLIRLFYSTNMAMSIFAPQLPSEPAASTTSTKYQSQRQRPREGDLRAICQRLRAIALHRS